MHVRMHTRMHMHPRGVHAMAYLPVRCMCGAYGSRHGSVCHHMPARATVCYHVTYVMEAPRPSKAREVRNRRRRPRRCARRRARRRGNGHVPRIVRGPAVAR